MLYIGFYLEIEEALRILGLPNDTCASYYDTGPIDLYLNSKQSALRFLYMDKGTCLFGVPVCEGYMYELEELLLNLLTAKKTFWKAVKDLSLDLSTLTLTAIEEEPEIVTTPEPFVINWTCEG